MNLENKIVVLTGGTSGVGREIVAKLHQKSSLVILGRNSKKLEVLKDHFPSIRTYLCDLTNIESVKSVCKSINENFSSVDVLINNAAIQNEPRFTDEDFNIENVCDEVTCNFTSICVLTHGLLPQLLKAKKSLILNINSGLAIAPKTSSAVYCATKSALHSLSISLRYQLENTQVSVLEAFLPMVDTPMTKGRGQKKMSPERAANDIIHGLQNELTTHYIGKVKILALIHRFFPNLAKKIMKSW